ncbi:MAG: hypothetical protein CMM56_04180 [Rhodospirillaceae bacterium]|nr:hypothetical protein [Rhodospirillaceae bacterium]
MNQRTLIALTCAFVVFTSLAIIGQRGQEASNPTSTVFLGGLIAELDSINLIELSIGGNETIATIEREETGWTLAQRNGYLANEQKINRMLLSLAEARIIEAKTANPEWHYRLGVESVDIDNANGVAVRLTGPDLTIKVIIGDDAGEGQVYARKIDEDQSYLIDSDPEVGNSVTDWLDTNILSIATNRIQQVKIQHSDGETLIIAKEGPDQTNFVVSDIPVNRELRYESIANTVGNTLSDISLQDVEMVSDSRGQSTLTEFLTFDGLVITAESANVNGSDWVTFSVGYSSPDNLEEEQSISENAVEVEAEALRLSEKLSGWRYRIPTYQFDQLIKRMEDLLAPLPEESS